MVWWILKHRSDFLPYWFTLHSRSVRRGTVVMTVTAESQDEQEGVSEKVWDSIDTCRTLILHLGKNINVTSLAIR